MALRDKAQQKREGVVSRPSTVTEAYGIINGWRPGDYGRAQIFLKSMSEVERKARLREEKRGEVKLRKKRKPMGQKPYPYRSRQYK